jgi:hypothetical protein
MGSRNLSKTAEKSSSSLCAAGVFKGKTGKGFVISLLVNTSQKLCGPKNVSYDKQLRPIIVKSPSAPSAQATHPIANRHYEEVKSSCPDSQTLKNLF